MAKRDIWLVSNAMSGSNDARALADLEAYCARADLRIAYRTIFPRDRLPTPAMLDAAGIGLLAIFAGDGTLNATIEHLAGWGGEVLVLPGGTMNLLYHRLFGELAMERAIEAAAFGDAMRVRPTIIQSQFGVGYAGLLAGPGASWNRVREAIRENSIIDMAESTVRAIDLTLGPGGVACVEPALGRREGYPLLQLNPLRDGIEVLAYYAETPREYLEQTFALLRRSFREGPHDNLGKARKIILSSTDGEPFGLLFDGEPHQSSARAEFTLAQCEVDLLATTSDG